jgi:hypothetical protein
MVHLAMHHCYASILMVQLDMHHIVMPAYWWSSLTCITLLWQHTDGPVVHASHCYDSIHPSRVILKMKGLGSSHVHVTILPSQFSRTHGLASSQIAACEWVRRNIEHRHWPRRIIALVPMKIDHCISWSLPKGLSNVSFPYIALYHLCVPSVLFCIHVCFLEGRNQILECYLE